MGYTHYWKQKRDFSVHEWHNLTTVARAVIKGSGIDIAGGSGDGKPEINRNSITFNGRGEYSHETFELTRIRREPHGYEKNSLREFDAFSFCKTAYKPYDAVVVAILIYIANTTGDSVLRITSDGNIFSKSKSDEFDEFTSARRILYAAQGSKS